MGVHTSNRALVPSSKKQDIKFSDVVGNLWMQCPIHTYILKLSCIVPFMGY